MVLEQKLKYTGTRATGRVDEAPSAREGSGGACSRRWAPHSESGQSGFRAQRTSQVRSGQTTRPLQPAAGEESCSSTDAAPSRVLRAPPAPASPSQRGLGLCHPVHPHSVTDRYPNWTAPNACPSENLEPGAGAGGRGLCADPSGRLHHSFVHFSLRMSKEKESTAPSLTQGSWLPAQRTPRPWELTLTS